MARLSRMAGTLTPEEFEAASSRYPRLSEKAKTVARAILVDGMTFKEVEVRCQLHRPKGRSL